jgi:hypothetical protein
MSEPRATDKVPGQRILSINAIGTAAFVVATGAGAAMKALVPVAAIVSSVLFVVGIAAFAIAYAGAVRRSRTDAIGLGGLFFLIERVAPATVRRRANLLLAVQFVVGIAGAASRVYTAMAACVLAPVFGLGLNGMWSARHGTFGPRPEVAGAAKASNDPSDRSE